MIGSFRTRAARRLGALLTAAGLVLAGGVVFATAASAHSSKLTGEASCNDNGTWSVTWKFDNDYNKTATVTKVSSTGGGTLGLPVTIPAKTGSGNTSVTAAQVNIPAASSSTTLTAKVTWADNYSTTVSKKVDRPSGCSDKRGASVKKTTCADAKGGVNVTLTNKKGAKSDVLFSITSPTETVTQSVGHSSTKDTTATVFVPVAPGGYTIMVTTADGFSKTFTGTIAACNAPGVEIEKTLLTQGPVHPGDRIAYLVKVTNTGNTDLYDVVVTDSLPDGTTLDEEGSDLRWKDSPNLTATIGALAAGSIEQLKLLVKVDDSTEGDGFSCSGGVDVVNTASVKGFYPQPAETASPSPSPYTATATASPVTLEFPDCASITVDKLFWQEEGYQGGWTFTTELSDGTVNGHDAKDSQTTGTEGYAPASFDLKGYFGEDGKDVTITETPQDGWSLYDVACQALVLKGGWSSFEVDSDGNGASLKVHPGDHIKCVFINKRIPASTTPPSTQTTPPTVTTTPPTEVLGEKESPTPTTSVLGEKLPFTGAPTSTGLILSLVLVAGGALLLFGSTRRDAKHRG